MLLAGVSGVFGHVGAVGGGEVDTWRKGDGAVGHVGMQEARADIRTGRPHDKVSRKGRGRPWKGAVWGDGIPGAH